MLGFEARLSCRHGCRLNGERLGRYTEKTIRVQYEPLYAMNCHNESTSWQLDRSHESGESHRKPLGATIYLQTTVVYKGSHKSKPQKATEMTGNGIEQNNESVIYRYNINYRRHNFCRQEKKKKIVLSHKKLPYSSENYIYRCI